MLIAREDVEIRTIDGVSLHATVVEPVGMRVKSVAILAHAMFARRTEFDRPHVEDGWLEALARAGARAIAFDFRGHGDSGTPASKGGFWSYDDLVRRDLPAVVEAARARADGARVVVMGHSLGGHVALAAQGTGQITADALLVASTNVWMPRWDRSIARRAIKAATLEAMKRTTARVGYFPARMLRQGSDDEAAPYVHDLVRFWQSDTWASGDGGEDYAAALANIAVPVISFVSTADRLQCVPECAKAMMATVPRGEVRVLSEPEPGSRLPGHMEVVTKSRAVRDAIARWAVDA